MERLDKNISLIGGSKMNDFIIDFQVTKMCNLNCEFCCGADKSKNDSDIEQIKKRV